VSGLEHEDFVATVLPDGSLLLPYAAPVVARGLPIADLPRLMTESFGRSEAPEAHNNLGVPRVRLLEPRWNRIDVVGNVYRYGERWWPETMTLAALLARSGGPTAKADAGALPYAYRRVGPSYVRTSLSPDEALQALDVVVFP
jgi:protein involved in polysaccharide export with SLBB domain